MLSLKTRRTILRIIPFGVIWFVFSMVYTQLEKGLLGDLGYYPATGNPYNFTSNLIITPLVSLIAGLVIGTIEITWFSRLFTWRSFGRKMVYKTTIYIGIIVLFLLMITLITNVVHFQTSIIDPRAWKYIRLFFINYAFLSVAIYMAAIIVVALFYSEVSENIGHGVLSNFFTGKYHRAKEEERIFMFLDMKSSTTIAEKLGHERYFEMLRDYYTDFSDPIIRYAGEIYQYVGDEVVVTWKLEHGLKDNNCIHCFFGMQQALVAQSEKYTREFGLVPGFRAGLHFGKVTTGEIGALKKEIVFTGDVLNTTSRIQGLCKPHGVAVLLSDVLAEALHSEPGLILTRLGETELRGRDEKIGISTIELSTR